MYKHTRIQYICCIYVYIYMHVYTCTSQNIHTHAHTHMHVHIHVGLMIHMCKSENFHTCVYLVLSRMSTLDDNSTEIVLFCVVEHGLMSRQLVNFSMEYLLLIICLCPAYPSIIKAIKKVPEKENN